MQVFRMNPDGTDQTRMTRDGRNDWFPHVSPDGARVVYISYGDDVKPGDHILGVYRPDGARFYQDDRLIGAIGVPGFAEAFFGIWLDARTSAPDLRQALLRRPGA